MKTEMMEVGKLTKDPRNARTHGDRMIGTIVRSLKTFGQQKPIVIGADDVVIAGNGTLEAAMRLGLGKIAVIRSKLTGAEARAYAITDNHTAELAAWDFDLLSLELEDLRDLDFDLDGLGFGSEELEKVLGATIHGEAGKTDPDSIPEPPDEAIEMHADMVSALRRSFAKPEPDILDFRIGFEPYEPSTSVPRSDTLH